MLLGSHSRQDAFALPGMTFDVDLEREASTHRKRNEGRGKTRFKAEQTEKWCKGGMNVLAGLRKEELPHGAGLDSFP